MGIDAARTDPVDQHRSDHRAIAAQLRDTTRDFLASFPFGPVAPSHDRATWSRMASDIGLQGVRIPEELGGSGLGLREEMLVHAELGRVLCTEPYLATVGQVAAALAVVAAAGISSAVDDQARIAAGELVAAAAVAWSSNERVPAARRTDISLVTTGSIEAVLDAGIADRLLVLAELDGQDALVWIRPNAPGVALTAMTALDLTRRPYRVTLDAAPGELLATGETARSAVRALRANAALALAVDSVGLAGRALELTVDYVQVRTQFGQTLASFQAVKHRCADMLVALEGARSALHLALEAVADPTTGHVGDAVGETATLAVARVHCGQSAFWIVNEALHLFGGIGYTWEHPIHLFLRRAKSNQQLLDPASQQRQVIAAAVAESYRRPDGVVAR